MNLSKGLGPTRTPCACRSGPSLVHCAGNRRVKTVRPHFTGDKHGYLRNAISKCSESRTAQPSDLAEADLTAALICTRDESFRTLHVWVDPNVIRIKIQLVRVRINVDMGE